MRDLIEEVEPGNVDQSIGPGCPTACPAPRSAVEVEASVNSATCWLLVMGPDTRLSDHEARASAGDYRAPIPRSLNLRHWLGS